MTTRIDARQVISRDVLDQIAVTAGVELDNLLRSLNSNDTSPLKLSVTGTNRVVDIGSIFVTNPETGKNRTIPIIFSALPNFTSGTITAPATGAGTITVSPGTNLVIAMTASQFLKVGINLDATGNISLIAGTAGASLAAATAPLSISNTFGAGYFVLRTDGSNNVANILTSDLYQYMGGGGSGSGSGSGEINYILTPDAETNSTTGWAGYADAAGTTPVDGTGGSATTLTLTSQNTTKIRGLYSFKLAKSAANGQGQGISYDFTIDKADQNTLLKIECFYNTDLTYNNNDIAVYIYDVTNATLITPAQTGITGWDKDLNGSGHFLTGFVTTNSLSYRLIFHVAGTGASTWDFYVDSIIVGPGKLTAGTGISEYAYNSSTSTTGSDTSSFASGVGGITIKNFSSANAIVNKRVQFGTNIASSDSIQLQVSQDGIQFYDAESIFPYIETSTAKFGMRLLRVSASSTQVDVEFGGDGANGTEAWSVYNTWVWKAVKVTTGVTYSGNNTVEYAYNSSISTSGSDTSSFDYGPGGVTIKNFSATGVVVTKRVRAQYNIQPSDDIQLKVSQDGTAWLDAESIFPYMELGALFYGMRCIRVSGSTTDVDVVFGGDGANASEAWSVYNTWKWRVVKSSAGVPVGFGIADATTVGLVSTAAQTFAGAKTFNAAISVNQGIVFPAADFSSAGANTLDDYEEGTWTPVFTGTGGSIGSTAYSTQIGRYTKVGNLVRCSFILVLANKGSWSGNVTITGLPFVNSSSPNDYAVGTISVWANYSTSIIGPTLYQSPGNATFGLRHITGAATLDAYTQVSDVSNTLQVVGTWTFNT